MKTFLVVGAVLLALAGLWWFVRRRGGQPGAAPVAAPPPHTSVRSKLEALSSAGCGAAAGAIGVKGSIVRDVCTYTPFNIALKAAPPVVHAAEAVGSTAAHVTVGAARGISHGAQAVAHVFSSIF